MAALREAGLVQTTRGRGGGTVVTLKPRTPPARARRPHLRGPTRASGWMRWSSAGSSSPARRTSRRAPTLDEEQRSQLERGARREVRRAGLDDPAELQRIEPLAASGRGDAGGAPGRRRPGLQRDDGAAAAAARGLDQPGLAQGGHRLAERRPGDVEDGGELALGRQGGPERVDPQPDRGRELLHARLERVVAAHRPQHRFGQVRGGGGGHDFILRAATAGVNRRRDPMV